MSQAGPEQKSITRLIVATSIGNALEWYDIAVYGYFAVYISKAFFPNNDPTTSLLLTFGTFGLSFLIRPIGLPPIVGFVATFAAGIVLTFLTPVAGMISDKVGRTTHMIAVNLLLLVSIYPAFLLLTRNPTPTVIVVAVFWLAILKSLYYGPLAALMSELFPAATRGTGLGLGYNIGVTLFGGMGPVIMTWLGGIAFIGDLAPGYYLTLVCVVSLSALITIRRTPPAS